MLRDQAQVHDQQTKLESMRAQMPAQAQAQASTSASVSQYSTSQEGSLRDFGSDCEQDAENIRQSVLVKVRVCGFCSGVAGKNKNTTNSEKKL